MKKNMSVLLLSFILGGSLFAQNLPSLFSDIKARQVGDVLSVILAENSFASQEFKNNNSTDSDTEISASSSGNIADFLPSFGGKGSYGSSYQGSDASQQKDRLSGKMTVRIVERTENGMFFIQGEREVGVNGEDNLMSLEGYIRAKDITTDNIVYSYNIADAKIDYRKSGITESFIEPGTFPKIFTFLVGGLMVAAGAGYFAFN